MHKPVTANRPNTRNRGCIKPGTVHDLGSDHYDRHVNTATKRHNHVRQLEALGYKVTLEPAA